MTGKGVRWGRTVGRSAPAFMVAGTTALLHLPAWREADYDICSCRSCCEAGQLVAVVCCEACAGRRIRWLCPPAVACSAGSVFCLLPLCLPCPLPFSSVCPHSSLLCPRPFHFCFVCPCSIPCAPGSSVRASSLLGPAVCQGQQFASCENCPVGSCNTGLQWRRVHRSIYLTAFFFLQSP